MTGTSADDCHDGWVVRAVVGLAKNVVERVDDVALEAESNVSVDGDVEFEAVIRCGGRLEYGLGHRDVTRLHSQDSGDILYGLEQRPPHAFGGAQGERGRLGHPGMSQHDRALRMPPD